jgi:hypothetical protein
MDNNNSPKAGLSHWAAIAATISLEGTGRRRCC